MAEEVVKSGSAKLNFKGFPFFIVILLPAVWRDGSNHICLDDIGDKQIHTAIVHDRKDAERRLLGGGRYYNQ